MWTGSSRCLARSRIWITVSPPGSSRSRASSAWLSRTGAAGILGLLQFFFLAFVLRPFPGQCSVAGLALQDALEAANGNRSHGLEKNPFGRRLNHGLGPVFNVKLFPQPRGNDHLAFGREPYGVCLDCCTHGSYGDIELIACQ